MACVAANVQMEQNVSLEPKEQTVSADLVDSAAYYEDMATKIKLEGEKLVSRGIINLFSGALIGGLGAAGLIWCSGKGGSLEGGGVALVFVISQFYIIPEIDPFNKIVGARLAMCI